MKTYISHSVKAVCLGLLVLARPAFGYPDGATAANEKSYSGTIASVNAGEKVLKVKGYLFSKSFVLADNCALIVGDRSAALSDFRPGQRVDVVYKDAGGVLVAKRISQKKLSYAGMVAGLDRAKHTLTVRQKSATKTFTLSDDCNVILNGNTRGTLEDVKLAARVTVTYEVPNSTLIARLIEQKSAVFVGTLEAINLPERTLSAGKRFLGDKKFHLADDCSILINGKPEGRISDLKLGQTYELSYDSVDGVNVVNRIAPAPPAEATASTAEQVKN